MRDRRRFPRVEIAIPVVIRRRGDTERLVTRDVSRHGAFVRTDQPRTERELVQLAFVLPTGESLDVMCMVARSIPPALADARGPGMGVDFFALSKEAKDRWDAFVRDVSLPLVRGTRVPPPPPPDDDVDEAPVRREHVRFDACFLVRMKDKAGLREFLTRDVSQGGMMLKTPLLRDVGTRIGLILVHPETDEEFALEGTVVRQVQSDEPKDRGLGIRFEGLDTERQQRLARFIETGVEALEVQEQPDAGALLELQRACEEEPDVAETHEALGVFLLERGDLSGAVLALSRALLLAPDAASVHEALASAYLELGDVARASAHERVFVGLTRYADDRAARERRASS